MAEVMRNSGIDVIGDIPWGTHFCSFYENKQDLLDILVPYFKTGLENNEFCLWIVSDPLTIEDATRALYAAIPGFDVYLANGKIEILPHTEFYLKSGKFDPQKVIHIWEDKITQLAENDFEGMRANGNEGWLNEEAWSDFIYYERELARVLSDKKIIVLCAYALAKCDANAMLDVAEVHQCALTKRNGEWHVVEVPELKQTKAQIKKQNRELESQVNERTFELNITNKELRKEVEQHKQTEARLKTILENTDTAYILLDTDFRILMQNPLAIDYIKQVHKHQAKEGDCFLDYFPQERKARFEGRAMDALEGNWVHYESSYPQSDGSTRWFNIRLFPIANQKEVLGLVVATTEVTQKVLLEQKMEEERIQKQREITDAVINGEERARQELGRELHDNINQILATSQLYLGVFKKRTPHYDPIINAAEGLVEKATEEIRKLSHSMISPFIGATSLVEALDYLINITEKTGLINITKEFTGIEENKISVKRKLAIYRIAQEQFQNIQKFAKATTIVFQLSQEGEKITLDIKDNGVGFDTSQKIKGIGLINIRTRASLLNGETQIISAPGKGCELKVVFN